MGKKILIVDDSPMIQKSTAEIFESAGYEVIGFACDGVEALEKCTSLNPDYMILDIIMQNMHGIECYREIVKRNLPVKMFFISCISNIHELKEKFKEEIPPELFLPKPATLEAIQHAFKFLSLPRPEVLSTPEVPAEAVTPV